MIALDAFCGAGGVSEGLRRAGFEVVGVDLEPQPHYPGEFIQGDALEMLEGDLSRFAYVHASPPCQASSKMRERWPDRHHVDLIAPVRERLWASGKPYSLENVVGAILVDPVTLCGSMFGLRVRRHRHFEASFPIPQPDCHHELQPYTVGVYGNTGAGADRGRPRREGRLNDAAEWREAMGIDWMTADELAQAIPPLYAEHVAQAARLVIA